MLHFHYRSLLLKEYLCKFEIHCAALTYLDFLLKILSYRQIKENAINLVDWGLVRRPVAVHGMYTMFLFNMFSSFQILYVILVTIADIKT